MSGVVPEPKGGRLGRRSLAAVRVDPVYAAAAMLVVNLALLLLYVCIDYRSQFHSDAAVKNLIAGEIVRSGRFFPPEWYHVNGDLMVAFGHVFILPFLGWTTNDFALHALSGLLVSALLLLALWSVAATVLERTWMRVGFIALVAGGISSSVAESLFGQASYGVVLGLVSLTLLSAWRAAASTRPRHRSAWLLLVAVVALMTYWANPQRAVATYTVPLVGAIAALFLTGNRPWARTFPVFGAHLVGAAVGSAVHVVVLAGVQNIAGAGAARWLPFAEMGRNALGTVQGILATYGELPPAGGAVMSATGLLAAARLGAAAVLACMVPVAMARLLRSQAESVRFLTGFAIASLAVFLFLHVTSSVPDMNDPVMSARYLIPSLVLGLLVLAAALERTLVNGPAAALAGLCLVIATVAPWGARLLNPPARDEARDALIEGLRARGLRYGYATYWNAGAITVLAGGHPTVRQVQIVNGVPVPMRHLASEAWYQPAAWRGPTFLMLSQTEAQQVDWTKLSASMGGGLKQISLAGFQVTVFPRNLAERLPGWDTALDGAMTIKPSLASPRTVGQYLPASGAVTAMPGESGYLHFGPYVPMGPGRYRATFEVVEELPGVVSVDVASQAGAQVHASGRAKGVGREAIGLEFELAGKTDNVEFRAQTDGRSVARLSRIIIERQ